MDRRKFAVAKGSLFWPIAMRYGIYLILYIVFAASLDQMLVWGNDRIAGAVDSVLMKQEVDMVNLLRTLFVMILAGTVVAFFKSLCGNHYSVSVQREVRGKLAEHLMEMPFSYFDEKGSGSVMTKLSSDIGEVGRFFSEILPVFLEDLITVIIVTVYLVQMDAMLMVVLFFTYPVMLVVANWLSKRLEAIVKRWRTKMDLRTHIAYDNIQGIVVGRSYNLYHVLKNRIDKVIDDIAEQASKSTRVSSMGYFLRGILTNIPVIICYLFALHETLNGRISVGDMLTFTVLIGRIIFPIGGIVFCLNDIRTAGVAFSRLQDIYVVESEEMAHRAQKTVESSESSLAAAKESGMANVNTAPAISWRDLHFSYDAEREILKGITFEIEQGETVAFVGGSGEGKSTIFRLLMGFYLKNSGDYYLFDKPCEEWGLASLREQFSYVSQNVFLLPDSIYKNVACGKADAEKEEVEAACKAAKIHDFAETLPQGYDTIVGERGAKLSGGECQRISIARAFLKDAPIVLLDEPTAAVDVGTESDIQEAIATITKGKTVVIIAHRLSTIRNADKIFVVHGGQIAEVGTHEELLERRGIYAELYGKEVTPDEE